MYIRIYVYIYIYICCIHPSDLRLVFSSLEGPVIMCVYICIYTYIYEYRKCVAVCSSVMHRVCIHIHIYIYCKCVVVCSSVLHRVYIYIHIYVYIACVLPCVPVCCIVLQCAKCWIMSLTKTSRNMFLFHWGPFIVYTLWLFRHLHQKHLWRDLFVSVRPCNYTHFFTIVLQCVVVCTCVLQCVTVSCSVL